MNKNYFKLAVLSLAVFQLIFILSQKSFAQTNQQKIKETAYCSLFSDELKNYESEIVQTRAYMTYSTVGRVDGGDSFFYSPECNNGDFFAVIRYEDDKDPFNGWGNFFFKLPKEKNYVLEVKLTGKIRSAAFPAFGHLAWCKNQFEIIAVESISNVTRNAVKPDFKAETTAENLKNVTSEIMSYFLGNRTEISNYIADEFVITGLSESSYNKTNYRELASKGLFGNIKNYEKQVISSGQLEFVSGSYKVFGFVLVIDKSGKEQAFDFENTYRYTNKSWILTEINFTKPPGF